MAMQKLTSDIQSLFCASTQICCYKTVVEELVYNSLDAESTSIAIRVNIEQNTIQVIDNGCGVSKLNIRLLGERHATSKCVDLAALKSIPNTYGYRGQSLSSIIEVSHSVKIASRYENSEETWMKSFYKGKEKESCLTSQRPSKGTTIDIKGFLYNLKIQKKAVVALKELNEIKIFLEQISLVHNNISLSLRDDTKNEIIFKVHKNRDLYQTLSSLFGIERKNIKELIVEKNHYKLTAYIGQKDDDLGNKHWVYLNGKVLLNSKINKIVNDNLIKSLKLNVINKRKVKSKNIYDQGDDCVTKTGMPFYFIFITCPYYDYDTSKLSRQTVVEFKNWDPINKLIEKMAKFYIGDMRLLNLKPVENNVINERKTHSTRDQVKIIMDKILGNHSKKIGVSQMQNGVKGKITKRNHKKYNNKIHFHEPNIDVHKNNSITKKIKNNNDAKEICGNETLHHNSKILNIREHSKKINTLYQAEARHSEIKNKTTNNKNKTKIEIEIPQQKNHKNEDKDKENGNQNFNKANNKKRKVLSSNLFNKHRRKYLKIHDKIDKCARKYRSKRETKLLQGTKKNKVQRKSKLNLLNVFAEDPTGSVKKRCNVLKNEIDNLVAFKNKQKRKVFINEIVHYSNIIRNNKKYSVRKRVGEIIIHNYIPKPSIISPCSFDDRQWNKKEKKLRKPSNRLLKTVLKTQELTNSEIDEVKLKINDNCLSPSISTGNVTYRQENSFDLSYENSMYTENIPILPRLTYESHNYEKNDNQIGLNQVLINKSAQNKNKYLKTHFISKESKDNFVISSRHCKALKKTSKVKYLKPKDSYLKIYQSGIEASRESSYTIEFSSCHKRKRNNDKVIKKLVEIETDKSHKHCDTEKQAFRNELDIIIGSTYTINQYATKEYAENETNKSSKGYESKDYIEDSIERIISGSPLIANKIFGVSNSENTTKTHIQEPLKITDIQEFSNEPMDPLNFCETVHSEDDLQVLFTNFRKENDSLFNEDFFVDSFLCDRNAYIQTNFKSTDSDYRLNKSLPIIQSQNIAVNALEGKERTNSCGNLQDVRSKTNHSMKIVNNENNNIPENKHDSVMNEVNNFNFQSRHRFVPKGMSQIFTTTKSRNVCDYILESEYFEKEIYSNFAGNIQSNYEILEPGVKSVQEFTTKAIDKERNKLNKDRASLIFDGTSIKNVQVLKQIDNKFIAAEITGKSHSSSEMSDYLVLFDQHAVHERIRLENNMTDYFNGNEWKSSTLDDFILKLSKDEIIYLHNYKEKFNQLGLQWTLLNDNDVAINAIPEAILGKNPRQVDVIMKAVKNLIIEEINAIKYQGGCISLYPKAIMDLVFSEACRYAIKFGDHLSNNDCVELMNLLSECKTPFQCAHGRPVMAVLMNIKRDVKKYQVNLRRVQEWVKNKKQVKKI